MFYDHFDELPPVINDDNQETYYPLSSLKSDANELNPDGQFKLPNMNLLPENYLHSKKIFKYHCGLCGKCVLILKYPIENSKKRKIDKSFVLEMDKEELIIQMGFEEGEKLNLLIDENKKETRSYLICKFCGVDLAYEGLNQELILVLSDSLVIDIKDAQINRNLALMQVKDEFLDNLIN